MRLGIRSLALGDMMGRSESRDRRGMAGCGKTGLAVDDVEFSVLVAVCRGWTGDLRCAC